MPLTLRRLRLRAVWLIVLPFLWLARPTPASLAVGGGMVLAGLFLRGWAAGVLEKDRGLSTKGPYALTRNPLYLGSLVIGLGVALTGGHWVWPVVFLLFYSAVYLPTMWREAEKLAVAYTDEYHAYAAKVPAFFPDRLPRPEVAQGFAWSRYRRNREWEAALGAVATFGLLFAKVVWS